MKKPRPSVVARSPKLVSHEDLAEIRGGDLVGINTIIQAINAEAKADADTKKQISDNLK